MKLLILYYSMFGHVHKMAEAVAEGARQVPGTEVVLARVPETLPATVLEKIGAVEAQKKFANIPVCTLDQLANADAVIFGTPTRFGNMCGQMRQFFDATGGIWSPCRKSRKRIYQFSYPAWRAGIHHHECPYYTLASRNAHRRTALFI